MAYVNGGYGARRSSVRSTSYGLSDLAACGCESAAPQSDGFDFSTVPSWVWIGAAVFAAAMILKKK